ncbi:EF-hand protein (macronuclear) [Tetrahymena thermophila SB210]|uniref:EF-hand protein n=1 Tax=Tetrahymena thermophila (strain SB210) TaxID=312017 RepID=A4VF55_TETTS|nr:EF-hand protein [Tetrahymena thermophila SB210]EDK31285.1 EF-hand protein [Tetrahymena thermophila SB210]|eukprot:XP_001470616.1 EF-hand protein [Tetrahymena thermophila SB210]
MGNSSSNQLSPELANKIMGVFRKIDTDGSKCIDKEETLKFWKSNYAKVNTDELFKAVDVDNSGTITEDEWMEFWNSVKKAGYSEQEIEEELEGLLEGFSWVYFDHK